jgi:acetoacetyl-CoA synthetase
VTTDFGEVQEGELLFTPSQARKKSSHIAQFMTFLEREENRVFTDYQALWEWSTSELAEFWSSFARFADVPFRSAAETVLWRGPQGGAEAARWFEGAELNYVDVFLAQDQDALALIARDESGGVERLSYGELAALAAKAAAGLSALGVRRGDRVAAVLPNGVAAVACFLATASLGAIWSSCAPEFGASSMVDRFAQIEPKVLIVAPVYVYGGKTFDLSQKIAALNSVLEPTAGTRAVGFEELISMTGDGAVLEPVAVRFSHPLWVLYSSGTTGLPKAIVQGHGGIVLEHLKALRLHCNLGPGERFFWFSTTGWMMWNLLVGGLLCGATVVAFDGNPLHPSPLALFEMAAEESVSFFGTSAPFLETCRKAGLEPRRQLDLSSISSVGSTGAPLSPEGFAWASRAIGDDVLVGSASGGTDVCTAFLTSCPLLPVYAGELQCAALGAAVSAFDEEGHPVVGEVGELVITEPMPSMPVAFYGDESGEKLHEAYFSRFPSLWRHGDWVKKTARGTYVVYGRSDATLNRGGVRMGTAEFYRVVEAAEEVADSLVVDTSELGREGELILFVVAAEQAGALGPGELETLIKQRLRENVSPRHVPDRVIVVPALPHTLNGKKVEVPIRRILLGTPVEKAVSADSLADREALGGTLAALRGAGLI